MRTFARGRHTHVVLVLDKIQGVWDEELEFGTTQGGTCAYKKYLYRVPIVVTCNMSTAHLEYLDSAVINRTSRAGGKRKKENTRWRSG